MQSRDILKIMLQIQIYLGIGENGFVNVSWEWAYNGNSDEKDTYLGDQAAANKASTVELSMKTTVTQID